MTNQIVSHNQQSIATIPTIQNTMDIVLYSLSETSKRQYQHTYSAWASFCDENGLARQAMTANNMIAFLEKDNLAHRTKQARLTHMRKLLEALHAQAPDNIEIESLYKQVKLLKIKRAESDKQVGIERPKHALSPEQIFKAFNVFNSDTKLDTRNRALLAVLLYAGLRRAEAASLQWQDIDFMNETISIRHGKGDKPRTIPILSSTLIKHLKAWYEIACLNTWVFCPFYKGDKLRGNKPMKTNAIYDVIKQVEKTLDIEGLSPHDMRRTIITNLLNGGASVADVQFLAGHANPQTTLGYAQVKDAKEVQGRLKNKLGY